MILVFINSIFSGIMRNVCSIVQYLSLNSGLHLQKKLLKIFANSFATLTNLPFSSSVIFPADCHFTVKYRGAGNIICKLKYSILRNISVIFHDECNYDYHLIIKEPPKKFEGEKNWKKRFAKTLRKHNYLKNEVFTAT